MQWLALHPMYNSPGKSDATSVFIPGAHDFARFWPGTTIVPFNNRLALPARRRAIIADVRDLGPCDGLSYFGHGTKKAIPSAGFDVSTIGELLAVALHPAPNGRAAVLYNACTTGAGIGADGGLADVTRDYLCAHAMQWCRVHGHTGSGHADENPNAVFVDGEGCDVGCAGGRWVVQPRARPLWMEHVLALKNHPVYRYWFQVQSVSTILAWLALPRDARPELKPWATW